MKKKQFTLEQHQEIGARLGLIRDEISTISVKIGNAYPVEIVDKLIRSQRILDQVRSDLDNKLFSEHHELEPNFLTDIYYGTLSGRRSR